MNGIPKPIPYPIERIAPRTALDSVKASVCTVARAGPIHGVQPIPNMTPNNGAPAMPPVVEIFGCNVGAKGNRPRNIPPIAIVNTPNTNVIVSS